MLSAGLRLGRKGILKQGKNKVLHAANSLFNEADQFLAFVVEMHAAPPYKHLGEKLN